VGEFDRFAALSFDCYGTLIDWETGIAAELVSWAEEHAIGADQDELIEVFAGHESGVQSEQPALRYPSVLAATLERIAAHYGVTATEEEEEAFGASVGRWPAFADSPEALARLKRRFRLIILSNVDRASFAESNARLGVEFDLIVTAEDVGAYKPSPRSFPALLDALPSIGVGRDELLHVAQSLYHDHEPAKTVGLPSVWIDRRHDRAGFGATPPPQGGAVNPDWIFPSLAAFADAAVDPSG
jgi:putative hydrolase of the HAD superfamily